MNIRSWMILGLLCFTSPIFASSSHFGAFVSTPIITKDPQYLRGYRAGAWYQPESFIWQKVHVYFDASYGHWWVTNPTPNKKLDIYSVSPYVRIFMTQNRYISSFVNLSIGLAYLSRTKIDHQNLGMHFAFQDQLGLGLSFGIKKQLSISLSALHYSNGSLCKKNAGITIPLMINAEYGFA